MADRIAAGEIFVGLDDEQAIAGLRRVEADFASTMQRMDRMEATADLKVDERKLKKDLAKAKAELAKHQKWVKEADGSYTRKHRIEVLKRIEATEKEARAALRMSRLRPRPALRFAESLSNVALLSASAC
jgi:phage shock protein A